MALSSRAGLSHLVDERRGHAERFKGDAVIAHEDAHRVDQPSPVAPQDSGSAPLGRSGRGQRAAQLFVRVIVVGGVVLGLALRLWLLFHQPISSDEANAGMLANGILHGHFQAFYPGQVYGGAEPYSLAVVVFLFGHSGFALHVEPMALSAAAGVLVWRVGLRLVRSRGVAAIGGAFVFAAPTANTLSSSIYQGRGLTLVCGLACLLMALRILDDTGMLRSRRGFAEFGTLGLAAGIGWWSLPEIMYFYPPAALILLGALVRDRSGRWLGARALRLGALFGAFLVGALPWIWTNLRSSFSSLRTSSFSGDQGSPATMLAAHFHQFMLYVLPMQLGLRVYRSGAWVSGSHVVSWVLAVLAFGVLLITALFCLRRGGRALALLCAVVLFPLLYSENPGTWYWQDGRYAVYLAPLLVLVVALGCDEAAFRLRAHTSTAWMPRGEVVLGAVVAVGCALALFSFRDATGVGVSSFAKGWGNPDSQAIGAVAALEHSHVVHGYADYWVAYKLDYLSGGRLVIATSGIGDDLDRWPAIDSTVEAVRSPAWIFVHPEAITQFSAFPIVGGPNQETEPVFLAGLKQARIKYRIVNAGVLEAVVARQEVRPRLYAGPLSIGG